MIQVMLRGGMGNQMFEYAHGLALAKKHHTDLVVDKTFLMDRFPRLPRYTYRTYELDAFALLPHFTMLSKIAAAAPIPGVWLGFDFGAAGIRDLFGVRKLIREKECWHFDPSVAEAGADICLWGFWQSEKYFTDAKEEVSRAFTFPEVLPSAARALADEIQRTTSVSLSVRRGDYVNAANAKVFGGTNLEYYDAAIAYIAQRISSPHFFIFSDDVAWCREHIKPSYPTTYIPADIGGRSAMQLSSLCKHHIIANSTFSWWAAWLNRNQEKIVIAPKQWAVGGQNQEDIFLPKWVIL